MSYTYTITRLTVEVLQDGYLVSARLISSYCDAYVVRRLRAEAEDAKNPSASISFCHLVARDECIERGIIYD